MTRRLAPVAAILATALMRANAPSAPQARPTPAPTGDRVSASNANIGRYEALYGTPQFRGLDDEQSRPWPNRQAIRTIGRLEEIPGRRKGRTSSSSSGKEPGNTREWDSEFALFEICGERVCLAIVPVQELQDVFSGGASQWIHRDVEVIGAIDKLNLPGLDPMSAPVVFQVWSVFDATPLQSRKKDGSEGSSLEPLVRYPKGVEGTVVTVKGVFRGANLFEDLPAESRRDESDWVLQDGPFSIWVTGKAPKGKGFSLDLQSRSDCRYRLEATGKVSTANGFIYLRASSLQLLGRAKQE
jgi:hypothetical protein